MTTQLPLTLRLPPTYGKDSFVIGNANEKALGWLERWPDWPLPSKSLNLYGPTGSGKTHLSYLWAGRGEAIALNNLSHFEQDQFLETQHVVLDDFGVPGYYDDTAVFHLLNHISSVSGTLLIISPYPVAQYKTPLSDLRSRLRSVAAQEIDLPDDRLLKAVLAKHFTDRQCTVSEQVGVAGIESASFHRDELATTKGDGIASAKGCLGVPLIAPVPTTEPVLVLV